MAPLQARKEYKHHLRLRDAPCQQAGGRRDSDDRAEREEEDSEAYGKGDGNRERHRGPQQPVRIMIVRKFSGFCNAYLIGDILIDAPYGTQLPEAQTVIITHEHCDHFAGLGALAGSKAASEFCANVVNGKEEEFGLCRGLNMEFPEAEVERVLNDGEVVGGDGFGLKVFHTPGHAKGAICLYEPDKKLLFSGDTVFPDGGLPNCALPSSEPAKLIESYERLASLDVKGIFSGHGEEEKEKNYISRMLRMLKSDNPY
ncbi:TPA: MBL fold metallo-hydrolase [Candidatus Micrarchaeota archaeon]|nr:MBL fold metallo-hydrolase [Candidatus Micrarchaeota archaeon]